MTEEIKIPSPAEIERIMIEKSLQEERDLDGLAQFFYLYIHRFQEQIKFMSKKQLIKLMNSLVGSEYNDEVSLKRANFLAKGLNTNSLIRTIGNSVESPLQDEKLQQFSKKEKELFHLLETLLAEKYVKSIENLDKENPPKTVQEAIKHLHNEKEFNKRSAVEKDSFATANQLLYTKTVMSQKVILEYLEQEAKKEEGENNVGTSK